MELWQTKVRMLYDAMPQFVWRFFQHAHLIGQTNQEEFV
jgi:hypothetical protein